VKFEWLEECEKGFQELKEKAYHYPYPNTSVRDRRIYGMICQKKALGVF
jgi:hypothetical protein